jgi:signal transduction histidine kinase
VREKNNPRLRAFELLVVIPTVLGVVLLCLRGDQLRSVSDPGLLLLWVGAIAIVELAPVAFWRGIQVGTGFPLLVALALVYPAPVAAATAFLASFDPRELRREVGLLRALFNRSQVALSILAASAAFHSMIPVLVPSKSPAITSLASPQWWHVLLAGLVAASVAYLVNVGLVTIGASLMYSLPAREVIRNFHIGDAREFLVSYLGLGALGVALAEVFVRVGGWAIPVFVVPLFFARQMFARSQALDEAHKELQDKALVLRALSDRMAEERQDERAQIAAYLHDDLAQLLFRLSLQVDIANRYLDLGDVRSTREALAEAKQTKNRTADAIRALVRDLHRSPLGREGLGESIQSFVNDVGANSGTRFEIQVEDLPLAPPIQVLVYQIAREAIMNALKHAQASLIQVSLSDNAGAVQLVVRDDGVGFDASAGEPEGHFGLTMMRERAQVAGGTFDLVSAKSHGTGVSVKFPSDWILSDEAAEREARRSAAEPLVTGPVKPDAVLDRRGSDGQSEPVGPEDPRDPRDAPEGSDPSPDSPDRPLPAYGA